MDTDAPTYMEAAEAAAALTPAPYGPGVPTYSATTPPPYGPPSDDADSTDTALPPPPVFGGKAESALTPPPYGPTVIAGDGAPPPPAVKAESALTPPPYGPGVVAGDATAPEPAAATEERPEMVRVSTPRTTPLLQQQGPQSSRARCLSSNASRLHTVGRCCGCDAAEHCGAAFRCCMRCRLCP